MSRNFFRRLSLEGSIACQIFVDLRLNRDILRLASGALKFSRRQQVTLGSIICATRFKFFDKTGNLLPVSCPKCGEEDSFSHLLRCAGLEIPESEDTAQLAEILRHMAVEAVGGNPGMPQPMMAEPASAEIDLAWSVSPNDEISF